MKIQEGEISRLILSAAVGPSCFLMSAQPYIMFPSADKFSGYPDFIFYQDLGPWDLPIPGLMTMV